MYPLGKRDVPVSCGHSRNWPLTASVGQRSRLAGVDRAMLCSQHAGHHHPINLPAASKNGYGPENSPIGTAWVTRRP